MSWDGDELNRIHNLHVREFKDIAVGQTVLQKFRVGEVPAAAALSHVVLGFSVVICCSKTAQHSTAAHTSDCFSRTNSHLQV